MFDVCFLPIYCFFFIFYSFLFPIIKPFVISRSFFYRSRFFNSSVTNRADARSPGVDAADRRRAAYCSRVSKIRAQRARTALCRHRQCAVTAFPSMPLPPRTRALIVNSTSAGAQVTPTSELSPSMKR